MLALAIHRINFILKSLDKNIFASPEKYRFLLAIFGALSCISISAPTTLANETTTFPNPINGVARWKIMEANIDKIVGMKREQVHKLFGGVDSQPGGVSNRQKEVIQLDANVAAEIEFNHGFVRYPTFVKSEEANRFWQFGESNDYVQITGPANTDDPRWPVMRDNLRNFMGMQRSKVEALLGTDLEDPKSQKFGQYAVGNRMLWFWYTDGIVTRFDIDDFHRRDEMISFSCIPEPRQNYEIGRLQKTKDSGQNINTSSLTWEQLHPFVHNFVGMNREQVAASIGKPRFNSSIYSEDDTEGFEVEQDLALQLLYRTDRVANCDFVRSKDAQRFNLPPTNSGPHYERSLRPESKSEQVLKRQEIFESNLASLMGMSKTQVHKVFGKSRMSPRFQSSPEFDCETGILSFTFDQDKVIKFSFRPYDIEQIISPPSPTIK